MFKIILIQLVHFRYTVLLAGSLCFCGGFVRMMSTFPGLMDSIDKDIQYWLTMFAQAMNGLANPLAFCLPTKVAVEWFPENEAPLGSGLITMSFVLGLAIATGITPIFFADQDLIQWMNVAWFVPAAIAFLCSVFLVRSDRPPTPPSHSAAHKHANHVKLSFWTKYVTQPP